MAKRVKSLLVGISAAELKRMAAAKEKIEKLEKKRKVMTTELAKIEKEIAKLLAGDAPTTRRRKAVKKKAAKKKVGRKKAAKKKVVAKKAGKKAAKRVAKKATKKTAKKTVRKAARKTTGKAAGKRAGGATLEDVVISVIKAAGKQMKFPDIRDTIMAKKLYKSKSKNFDNVLRRTISTAKGIKRVARGVYAVK